MSEKIILICPLCKKVRLEVDKSDIGKKVRCDYCKGVFVVPGTPDPPIAGVVADDIVYLYCNHCGIKLQTAKRLVGQQVSCPGCKGQVMVPGQPAKIPFPTKDLKKLCGTLACVVLLLLVSTMCGFLPFVLVGLVIGVIIALFQIAFGR